MSSFLPKALLVIIDLYINILGVCDHYKLLLDHCGQDFRHNSIVLVKQKNTADFRSVRLLMTEAEENGGWQLRMNVW